MIAGVDSKPYSLEYSSNLQLKKFKSEIGCIVIVENQFEFKKQYVKILRDVLHARNVKTKRNVLASYEILELTNGDYSALNEFYDKINQHIEKLNIFYCSFNTKRIAQILTYGKSKIKKMNVDEFLSSHLDNAFPHICIWKILPYLKSIQAEIISDSFTTNPTNAWQDVSAYEKFRMVTDGDSINPLISTSDIILKVLEQRLLESQKSLFRDQIKNVLAFENPEKNNLFIHQIDNRDLPKITPLKHAKFKLGLFLKKPSFFIIKSKRSAIEMEFIKFHSEKLMNLVSKKDGSLLFFDQRTHQDSILDGDTLIYLDSQGKTTAQNIKKIMSKKIEIISLDKIKG